MEKASERKIPIKAFHREECLLNFSGEVVSREMNWKFYSKRISTIFASFPFISLHFYSQHITTYLEHKAAFRRFYWYLSAKTITPFHFNSLGCNGQRDPYVTSNINILAVKVAFVLRLCYFTRKFTSFSISRREKMQITESLYSSLRLTHPFRLELMVKWSWVMNFIDHWIYGTKQPCSSRGAEYGSQSQTEAVKESITHPDWFETQWILLSNIFSRSVPLNKCLIKI